VKELIGQLKETLEKDGAAAVATIVRQSGSAPRGLGTSCIFRRDGSVIGTIGGGLLEAQTAMDAVRAIESARSERIHFSLKGTEVAETDMLCGGEVDIFLEPVFKGGHHIDSLIHAVESTLARGGSGVLVTLLEEGARGAAKAFFGQSGPLGGDMLLAGRIKDAVLAELPQVLRKRAPATVTFSPGEGGMVELFLEPVVGNPPLYIFGAGHVSRQIAPLAARVGFMVSVIDDRDDFADPRAFPEASKVVTIPFEGAVKALGIGDGSYVVIVTRGHLYDRDVLAQALRTTARYIGMIGSRRKRDAVYRSLMAEGFTQDDLLRVHSPIGLDIGAETPEEIAVSIVAELIKVRAGKE
jgi:xanthine dehydrogenase accessory factor